MRFTTLLDGREQHNGIEVLLCECWKEGKLIFYTAVRADWERPRGSFHKDYCSIMDLDHDQERGTWHVFKSSSSHLITQLRGKDIPRMERLKLLLGYEVTLHGWTIKPAS